MIYDSLSERIYRETLERLTAWGYLSSLNDLLSSESIDERMDRIDVHSSGLETVDAVHCVLDEKRTLAFLQAIERIVRPGDVVVEAGLGTGIMAVMALALGAEVYGIEINRETMALSKRLLFSFADDGLIKEEMLRLTCADAIGWTAERKIDLLISENIYAGMFYEMQIPIVNHLLTFMAPSGRVIPEGMCSYVMLVEAECPEGKAHGESFSPSEAEGRIYEFTELSGPVLYDVLDFCRRNDINCKVDLQMHANTAGPVNSLLIYSPVKVMRDLILRREDMIFMGEDIFIVIDPPVEVQKGDELRLSMRYRRGGKPEDGHYCISKL